MADNAQLKAAISNVIKTNGTQAITGQVLQNALLTMINSLGANYQFVGIATTTTNPGTPDQNVFYLAGEGTYTNFSNLTIDVGQLGVLKWNGTWSKQIIEIGSAGGGNMILDWNTDVATTRKQVLQKYRKPGIQISYKSPNIGWVNEQFIGTSAQILDGTFGKDIYWSQIPNSENVCSPFNINDINSIIQFSEDEVLGWENKFITSNGVENTNAQFRMSPMYEIDNSVLYAIRVFYVAGWQNSLIVAQYDENQNFISGISFSAKNMFYPNTKVFYEYGYSLFSFNPKCKYYKVVFPLSSGEVKSKVEIIGLNKSLSFINNTDYPNRNFALPNLYPFIGSSGVPIGSLLKDYNGTDFIPIELGDIIYTNAVKVGSAVALAFYDDKKQFIEYIDPTNESLYVSGVVNIYEYIVNDERYKYVRGSFQVNRTSGILFIKRAAFKKSENQPIDLSIFENKSRFNSYLFPITGNICDSVVTITTSDSNVSIQGNKIIKTGDSPVYGSFDINLSTSDPVVAYPNCINLIMVKIKLLSIEASDVTEAVITCQFQGTKTYIFKVGDEKILLVAKNTIASVKQNLAFLSDTPLFIYNKSTWEIVDKQVIHLNKSAFKAMQEFCYSDYDTNSNNKQETGFDGSIINKIPNFWDLAKKGFNFVEASVYSKYSSNVMPSEELNQKTYASFGDSITEYAQDTVKLSNGDKQVSKLSYPTYIAAYFNFKLLNLGKSGSTPRGNLTDENLAKLPDDTVLVTLSGGQNGWVTDEDIDSLDRSTDVGCFNYAINYVRNKFPKCQIVLVPTYIGNGDSQCIADYKRISDNKNVPIADTNNLKLIDWERDKTENIIRYDNVHLTGYGAKRFAAVVRETIRPLIF